MSEARTFFRTLLEEAIRSVASDVHLKGGAKPRFRIQGKMCEQETAEPVSNEQVEDLVGLIAGEDVLAKADNYDTSFHDLGCRFRINISRTYDPLSETRRGIQLSARILPTAILSVEEIGFPNRCYEDIVDLERGLVLVTGITGSGKSTTLASLLSAVNHRHKKKVVTLEHPVEFWFEDEKSFFTQREIPTSVGSFADGVYEALRQDPDIIFIGEIRDDRTTDASLKAVDSGHLVFSTLHSISATNAISRLVKFVPEKMAPRIRHELSLHVEYVLAQQLLPRKTGLGRVLAMEILHPGKDPAPRKFIREGGDKVRLCDYMLSHTQTGNLLMDESIWKLYARRRISGMTAVRYAHNRKEMQKRVETGG